MVICPDCNGEGSYLDDDGAINFCELCNGDGRITQTDWENYVIDHDGLYGEES